MIRIGTAGIPLGCKGGNTLDGIRCVKELGLSAMEIEFVRNIYLNEKKAQEVGEYARNLGILLSCHAPYYINLASQDREVQEKSKYYVGRTLNIADALKASVAVFHPGYYSNRTPEEAYKMISDSLKLFNPKTRIGVETTGKQKQFGTLDEMIMLAQEHEKVVPVIDFGHVHARGGGCVKTKDDFRSILEKVDALGKNPIHCHLSCVRFSNGNEREHIPLSEKQPDFRLLAEVVKENGFDLTIISESPLIEHDALLFKGWVEEK